jgi:phenylpropionate dioxygenase-like ring-hydroxylating dioxygenase large terminal subunit
MLDTAEQPPKSIPFEVINPERIPAARYFDQEFFDLERKHLWPRVWQMACRLEEIPEVGDWVEYKILDDSVIVIRTETGVKAFHNACRHRGMRLVSNHGNCAHNGFICPFHGWRFNMNGKNTYVFGPDIFSPENLEKADLNLVACRLETWGGCAFINFDDQAPSLLECLGPVAQRLDARHVDKLKVDAWYATILPTNWKLAMEAFMEGYHLTSTHPQLHLLSTHSGHYDTDYGASPNPPTITTGRQWVDTYIQHIARLSSGMNGMITAAEVKIAESLKDMELPDDLAAVPMAFHNRLWKDITDSSRASGIPAPDLVELARTTEFNAVEFMFPHYFLLPMFSGMASYRIRPLTAETCLFELWSLALHPEGEQLDVPVAPAPVAYDDPQIPEIPLQDYYNLPLQQLGLHARGFEYMRLAKKVEGMISNYQRLIDGYLSGVDPAMLAKASQMVNSGLDSPIKDIGF